MDGFYAGSSVRAGDPGRGVRDGVLTVRSKGPDSFLGGGAGLSAGTARFSFRVRAPQAGAGRVVPRSGADGAEDVAVPYEVVGESEWQTVTVELPVAEKAGILRLYLPSGSAAVDFDDIVLTAPRGKPRRWTF